MPEADDQNKRIADTFAKFLKNLAGLRQLTHDREFIRSAKDALEAEKERITWSKVGATSREDYERILRGEK